MIQKKRTYSGSLRIAFKRGLINLWVFKTAIYRNNTVFPLIF